MNDSRQIGIAVIGYGYWSPKLIRNIRSNPDFKLIAICEKDFSRHALIVSENPDVMVGDDYREIFKRDDIEAVVIATIPSSHFRIAKQALENGKNVLVEKPLVLSVPEGEILVELARKRGLTLMVDHTYLYSPAIQALRDLVRKGKLGKVFSVESTRVSLGLFQRDSNVIWDLAPHDVSILLSIFDEKPVAVSVVGSKTVMHRLLKHGQESIAHIMFYYKSGFVAHVHVSWISPVKVRQITIVGSEKMAVYDQLALEQLRVFDHGVYVANEGQESGPLFAYKTGTIEGVLLASGSEDLAVMVNDFLDAIRSKKKPVSNDMLALDVVRILAAAQRSLISGGKKVSISYHGAHPMLLKLREKYTRFRHSY